MSVLLAAAIAAAGCARKAAPVREEGTARAPVEASDVPALTPRPAGRIAPVIWIGLDGLDWDFMDRLAREGKLPNWSRLVSGGYAANLRSFMPILSPVVWNTIATGVGPDVHRVLDFQEIDPVTGARVPISGRSRAVPAIWNIASSRGVKVGVVGWWATYPAEEVNGFLVSDHAQPILYGKAQGESGVAYPPSLDAAVDRVVASDGSPGEADLAPFLHESPEEIASALKANNPSNPVVQLSRILGQTRVYQRLARDLYDREHPDLLAVYFEGTDEIGHVFAPDTPPRLPCASQEDFARYHDVAERYFVVIDEILGQWMRRAEADGATIVVNSDHGFKWGDDRTCIRSSFNWATAAFWHRMNGVFVAWGARVRRGEPRGEASVFDMAPTVLALLNLPADRRMPGHPISKAFASLPALPREDLFGRVRVTRVAAVQVGTRQASEFEKNLRALGYLSGSDSAATAAAATGAAGTPPGMTPGAWNDLGLYERDTSRDANAARKDFLEALRLAPAYHSPMFNLAILERDEGHDRDALDWLFRALAAGHADPEGTVLEWAVEYDRRGKGALERTLLERASGRYPESEPIAKALARIRFLGQDCAGAFQTVQPFLAQSSDVELLNQAGLYETCLGRKEDAIRTFERSLALEPGQPGVEQALGVLRKQR